MPKPPSKYTVPEPDYSNLPSLYSITLPIVGDFGKKKLPHSVTTFLCLTPNMVTENSISTEQIYDLDDLDQTVKENTNQNVLQIEGTGLVFNRVPLIEKRAMSKQNTASGEGLYTTSGQGGFIQSAIIEAGLNEPVFGGECAPVEFEKLSVLKQLTDAGFHDFCIAVSYLLDKLQNSKVSLNIIAFPEGKKFSMCLNGSKRTGAVLLIERPNGQLSCILEILRSDGWAVSTLLVKAISEISIIHFQYLIRKLLSKLFYAGGHWPENIQDKVFLLKRLKHIENQEPQKWGQRILNNI